MFSSVRNYATKVSRNNGIKAHLPTLMPLVLTAKTEEIKAFLCRKDLPTSMTGVYNSRHMSGYRLLEGASSNVIDANEREFNNISIFQYAYWANDAGLLRIMLESIADGSYVEYRELLLQQLLGWKNRSIHYSIGKEDYKVPRFKLEPLYHAMSELLSLLKQAHVSDGYKISPQEYEKIEKAFASVVSIQNTLPAHYYSKTPFSLVKKQSREILFISENRFTTLSLEQLIANLKSITDQWSAGAFSQNILAGIAGMLTAIQKFDKNMIAQCDALIQLLQDNIKAFPKQDVAPIDDEFIDLIPHTIESELNKLKVTSTPAVAPAPKLFEGNFFKEQANSQVCDLAKKAIGFVRHGKSREAVMAIQQNGFAAITAVILTDPADRRFAAISPLRYALWALDAQVVAEILNVIDALPNAADIAQALYDHLVETSHVKYEFKGKTVIEEFYDMLTLERAYIDISKMLSEEAAKNPHAASTDKADLLAKLGELQCQIPVHVFYELFAQGESAPFLARDFKQTNVERNYGMIYFNSGLNALFEPHKCQGLGKDHIIYVEENVKGAARLEIKKPVPMTAAAQFNAQSAKLRALALTRMDQIQDSLNAFYTKHKIQIRKLSLT